MRRVMSLLSAVGLLLIVPSIPACSSSSDSSESSDAVRVPTKTWTWVDIPGSKCGNGQPTGIGIYVVPESPDVVFYMAGGGACWDGETCYGRKWATYMASGFTKNEFASDSQARTVQTLPNGNTPFRGKSIVYVPYCTGDDHAGSNVIQYDYGGTSYTAHHVGYDNVGLALDYMASVSPRMKRLVLAGVSAGGFGTVFNYDRAQQRFPGVRVDAIDDSGPPIEPTAGRWDTVRARWNVQIPSDCRTCGDASGYFQFLASKYSKGPNRFALISYTFDKVIADYMGISAEVFNTQLQDLGRKITSSWPAARYYYIPGTLHVGLANESSLSFYIWLKSMLDDDPNWANHPN